MQSLMSRRSSLGVIAAIATAPLTGCVNLPREDLDGGVLEGRVVVQWDREDKFIYRIVDKNPLRFKPSFLDDFIVPQEMYTDGGSVPRIFWSVPGLSPWGLGPAYIIHDWIFQVHRCRWQAPSHETNITFEQSAIILGQVGVCLVNAGLIDHDKLNEVVWAVRTHYARDKWDKPGNSEECKSPKAKAVARRQGATVADFVIPRTRGQP
jgi:hypothetical protein